MRLSPRAAIGETARSKRFPQKVPPSLTSPPRDAVARLGTAQCDAKEYVRNRVMIKS